MSTNYKPNYAINPGVTVQKLMELNNWNNKELALRLNLNQNTVGKIISGVDKITPETADKLAKVFSMKASFFINLQALYDETLIRQANFEEIDQLKKFPYKDMVNFGWVEKTRKDEEKLNNLYGFLGIVSLFQLPKVESIAYRKSETSTFSPESLACWLRKGDIEGNKIETNDFNKPALESIIPELRVLTNMPFDEIKVRLIDLCKTVGVAVVFVPYLKNSCVNGASKWLDSSKILIQISNKNNCEDIIWFTLFHELGHVIHHLSKSKKSVFVDLTESEKDVFEIEADNFAKNSLISDLDYNKFVKNGIFDRSRVIEFAKSIKIDPGLLAGRLSHDKHLDWSRVKDLRRTVTF